MNMSFECLNCWSFLRSEQILQATKRRDYGIRMRACVDDCFRNHYLVHSKPSGQSIQGNVEQDAAPQDPTALVADLIDRRFERDRSSESVLRRSDLGVLETLARKYEP